MSRARGFCPGGLCLGVGLLTGVLFPQLSLSRDNDFLSQRGHRPPLGLSWHALSLSSEYGTQRRAIYGTHLTRY